MFITLFISLFNSNFFESSFFCIKEHICVPSVCTKYKTTYLRPWMKYVGIHYYHDSSRSNYSYSVSLHIWKEYARTGCFILICSTKALKWQLINGYTTYTEVIGDPQNSRLCFCENLLYLIKNFYLMSNLYFVV